MEQSNRVLKWEFILACTIQAVMFTAAAVGIWYGLVADVNQNTRGIQATKEAVVAVREENRIAIMEVREATAKLIADLDYSAERREARLMKQMEEIKGNVSWLVRREADRKDQ